MKGIALSSLHKFSILAFSFLTQAATAQTGPSASDVARGVAAAVNNYSQAISCTDMSVKAKDIAALVPYKSFDDQMEATFAVLWSGDIGCLGGSGTSSTHIALVKVGVGGTYYVEPMQSSPAIQFNSPVRYIERIVGNTSDTLILEGKSFGPNDSNCCPSVNTRFTLKSDQNGNWALVDKKIVPARK